MLSDRLYQIWLLLLQTWAGDGRLLSAGINALRINPGRQTQRLKRIVNRLAEGDKSDLLPIEVLPGSSMPRAAGAYAKSTGKIYLNER